MKSSEAYLKKSLKWTAIKAENGKMLHAYTMHLRGCCNVMQHLQHMEELAIPSNLRLIASKLLCELQEKRRTSAYDTQQKIGRRVKFQHLVAFVATSVAVNTEKAEYAIKHDKKVKFLRSQGYCFGCLLKGHLSKNCKRRLMSQICQMKHSAALHIQITGKSTKTAETGEPPISSALVSAGDVAGSRKDCVLTIAPVRVKVSQGNKYIQT